MKHDTRWGNSNLASEWELVGRKWWPEKKPKNINLNSGEPLEKLRSKKENNLPIKALGKFVINLKRFTQQDQTIQDPLHRRGNKKHSIKIIYKLRKEIYIICAFNWLLFYFLWFAEFHKMNLI